MAKKTQRIPKYGRISKPPPMRLTDRDNRILEAVHGYDGMLGFSQILRLFFTGVSQAKQRLMLLYQNRYLNRPNKEQRRRTPEMIYWLDKRGAEIVASLNSISVSEIKWVNKPRLFQVEHNLAVNDFRLDIEEACKKHPKIDLDSWIPEREFMSYPDKIEYSFQGRQLQRKIIPDGYFLLTTPNHHLRYLLEIDRSTEDNPRFLRDKVVPGLAYIKTKKYEERFGHVSGRWLVVTTGKRRMQNMLDHARLGEAEGIFYFTTYDKIKSSTILSDPIWHRADRDDKVPLLFLD